MGTRPARGDAMKYEEVDGHLSFLVPGARVVLRNDYGPLPVVGDLLTPSGPRFLQRVAAGTMATVVSVDRVPSPLWINVQVIKGAVLQLDKAIEYEEYSMAYGGFAKHESATIVTDGYQATFWRPPADHPWWHHFPRVQRADE